MDVSTGIKLLSPVGSRTDSFSFNSVLVGGKVYSSVSELVTLICYRSPHVNFKFLSATNLDLDRLSKIAFFKKK